MNIKPCGFYVLVELREVSAVSESGIVLATAKQIDREQEGEPMGIVLSFGDLAFLGWDGCTAETAEGRAKQWGLEKGDMAIFSRYDGDMPLAIREIKGFSNYRLVPDKAFKGKVEDYA
jgi:co-chaperonin GroES (HSP10)